MLKRGNTKVEHGAVWIGVKDGYVSENSKL
jgi:hypothetical protein